MYPPRFARLGIVALLLAILFGQPLAAHAADPFVPATGAEAIRTALFDGQSALLLGDADGARASVDAAQTAAAPMLTGFGRG